MKDKKYNGSVSVREDFLVSLIRWLEHLVWAKRHFRYQDSQNIILFFRTAELQGRHSTEIKTQRSL